MSYNVALLVESSNTYSRNLLTGISRYIREHGSWTLCFEETALDSPVPNWFNTWRGDGIIVRTRNQELIHQILRHEEKIVDLSPYRSPGFPTVYPDYAASARLAAEHFKERQLRHFAYVGLPSEKYSRRRREAFCQSFDVPISVFEGEQNEFMENNGLGSRRFIDWLRHLPKPCGIMVCYDLLGVYLIQSCVQAGIAVPEEISVVGVNNDELLCHLSPVSLSSVAQDSQTAGYEAAHLLHQLMDGQEPPETPLVIQPLYVVARASTDFCAVADQLTRKSLELIYSRACQGITVSQIAEELNVSRRALERRFKQLLNVTIHDRIRQVQLQRACEWLGSESLTLENIARRAGLKNAPQLAILFKRYYGQTPGEYRKAIADRNGSSCQTKPSN